MDNIAYRLKQADPKHVNLKPAGRLPRPPYGDLQ